MKLVASQFMWRKTGMQFGECGITIRPLCWNRCPSVCPGLSSDFPWTPVHLESGDWTNVTCSGVDHCTCVDLCELELPYPTGSIEGVKIDGVVLDASQYAVRDFRKLIRVNDEGCFPDCNDLSLPDTEPGTWSVTLTYGRPVPELVKLAAQEFACQLIKSCVGKPCDLPQRMQSISRQGVTVSFLDPMAFLQDGMTGIYLVDLAIATYNPHRIYKKPSVSSPDTLGQRTVITWPST